MTTQQNGQSGRNVGQGIALIACAAVTGGVMYFVYIKGGWVSAVIILIGVVILEIKSKDIDRIAIPALKRLTEKLKRGGGA